MQLFYILSKIMNAYSLMHFSQRGSLPNNATNTMMIYVPIIGINNDVVIVHVCIYYYCIRNNKYHLLVCGAFLLLYTTIA